MGFLKDFFSRSAREVITKAIIQGFVWIFILVAFVTLPLYDCRRIRQILQDSVK